MDIIYMKWDSGNEENGWYNINCKYLTYSLRVENGIVKHAVKEGSNIFETVYPYRYNNRYGIWDNVVGCYSLKYFKRLVKSGEII